MHLSECAPELIARGSIPCDPVQQSNPPVTQGPPAAINQSSYGKASSGQLYDARDALFMPNQPSSASQPVWEPREWAQQRGRDVWDSPAPHQAPGNFYRNPRTAGESNHHDYLMSTGFMNNHDEISGGYVYGQRSSSSYFDDDTGNTPLYHEDRNRDASFRQSYSNRSFTESNNPLSYPPPPNLLPRYQSQQPQQQQQQQQQRTHHLQPYHSQDSASNQPGSQDHFTNIKSLR